MAAAHHFVCCECEDDFAEFNDLRSHLSALHLCWRPFSCLYCEELGATASDVKAHLDEAHPALDSRMLYAPDEPKKAELDRMVVDSIEKSTISEQLLLIGMPPAPRKRAPAQTAAAPAAADGQQGAQNAGSDPKRGRMNGESGGAQEKEKEPKRAPMAKGYMPCAQCGLSQRSVAVDRLNAHIYEVHLQQWPFSCLHCDANFETKQAVLSHSEREHVDTKAAVGEHGTEEFDQQLQKLLRLCFKKHAPPQKRAAAGGAEAAAPQPPPDAPVRRSQRRSLQQPAAVATPAPLPDEQVTAGSAPEPQFTRIKQEPDLEMDIDPPAEAPQVLEMAESASDEPPQAAASQPLAAAASQQPQVPWANLLRQIQQSITAIRDKQRVTSREAILARLQHYFKVEKPHAVAEFDRVVDDGLVQTVFLPSTGQATYRCVPTLQRRLALSSANVLWHFVQLVNKWPESIGKGKSLELLTAYSQKVVRFTPNRLPLLEKMMRQAATTALERGLVVEDADGGFRIGEQAQWLVRQWRQGVPDSELRDAFLDSVQLLPDFSAATATKTEPVAKPELADPYVMGEPMSEMSSLVAASAVATVDLSGGGGGGGVEGKTKAQAPKQPQRDGRRKACASCRAGLTQKVRTPAGVIERCANASCRRLVVSAALVQPLGSTAAAADKLPRVNLWQQTMQAGMRGGSQREHTDTEQAASGSPEVGMVKEEPLIADEDLIKREPEGERSEMS